MSEEDARLQEQLEAGMMAAGAAAGLQPGTGATTIPQEAVYMSVPPGAPSPRVVTTQQHAAPRVVQGQPGQARVQVNSH